jgi:3-oxoacyl-[acyl-carrier protein] reductase
MKTSKKIAVISGGGGFLGSAIAETLMFNDFIVIAVERENDGKADAENKHFKFADISDVSAVKKIAEEVKKEYGEIFTIIHAASAPLSRKPVLSLSEDDFERQFAVNVRGGFHLCKYFSEMLSSNGAIIGITSSAIFPESAYMKSGSYVAAKCGLQGLLRALFFEMPFRIYSIAPAFMPGGINGDMPEAVCELLMKKSRPEDIADPKKVAEAVLSLVNDLEKKWSGKTIAMPGFLVRE